MESIFWDLVTSGSRECRDKNQPTSTPTSMFLEAFASTFTAIFTTAVSEMLENRLFLDVLLLAHANYQSSKISSSPTRAYRCNQESVFPNNTRNNVTKLTFSINCRRFSRALFWTLRYLPRGVSSNLVFIVFSHS